MITATTVASDALMPLIKPQSVISPFVKSAAKNYNNCLGALTLLLLEDRKSAQPIDQGFCRVAKELLGATSDYLNAFQDIAARILQVKNSATDQVNMRFKHGEWRLLDKAEAISMLVQEMRPELDRFARLAGHIDGDRRLRSREIFWRAADYSNKSKSLASAWTPFASDKVCVTQKLKEAEAFLDATHPCFHQAVLAGADVIKVWQIVWDNRAVFDRVIEGYTLRDKTAFDFGETIALPKPTPPALKVYSKLPFSQPTAA